MLRQIALSSALRLAGLFLCVTLTSTAYAAGAPPRAPNPGKAAPQQARKPTGSMDSESKKFKVGGKVKDKKELDFSDANIDGSAKAPPGLGLGARDGEMPSDFVKIRYHWHDQMISSTSGISN